MFFTFIPFEMKGINVCLIIQIAMYVFYGYVVIFP